ncbi:MAG: inorganic pyrophosphatase [Planctomycetota bacterium]
MAFPQAFYRWRPHPWHGLEVGPDPPNLVTAYIEITPFDAVKYEVDKKTGYIRVDRPQSGAAQPPTLYGFIPRTLCGDRVAKLSPGASKGDGDPLDICVVSERPITRADIILNARVVGGLQTIDHGEADDKIVAVLQNDLFWGKCEDLAQLPENLIARLRHYFSTYKLKPGEALNASATAIYDCAQAGKVIQAAIEDYAAEFGG